MMTTRALDGKLESRPMSNNRDVTFDGHCYFFSHGDASVVKEVQAHAEVNLAFIGKKDLLGLKKIYMSVAGLADTTTDKATLKKHWVPDLEAWFVHGIDTPGLTLIHVQASSVQYWIGMEEGTVEYNRKRQLAS
jgi:general stress protein 26